MKPDHKYDPEDIESLLLHKQYNELYEAEKNFILRHISSEEEYNEMRDLLLSTKNTDLNDDDEALYVLKNDLREKFIRHHNRPSWIRAFTNLIAYTPGESFAPFALRMAAIVLIIGGFSIVMYFSFAEKEGEKGSSFSNNIPQLPKMKKEKRVKPDTLDSTSKKIPEKIKQVIPQPAPEKNTLTEKEGPPGLAESVSVKENEALMDILFTAL